MGTNAKIVFYDIIGVLKLLSIFWGSLAVLPIDVGFPFLKYLVKPKLSFLVL